MNIRVYEVPVHTQLASGITIVSMTTVVADDPIQACHYAIDSVSSFCEMDEDTAHLHHAAFEDDAIVICEL